MPRSRVATHLAGPALRCQPDSRLVALSREGEGSAFEEIVRRYRPGLVAYAATVVRPDRAEDVVQSALIKAHGALADADPDTRVRPWLFTIVRNTALNDLRDEPRHEPLEHGFDGCPQPPEVAEQRRQLDELVDALRSLPRAQREAIVEHELEGQSHEQIAATHGSTRAAVRGLIFRARRALRDGVGILIPISVLRYLLAGSGPLGGEATIGAAAGGGAGMATKTGVATIVAALAIGGGISLNRNRDGESGGWASARPDQHRGGAAGTTKVADSSASSRRGGVGERTGDEGDGSGGSEGDGDAREVDDGAPGGGGGSGHDEIEDPESDEGPGHEGGEGSGEGETMGIEAGEHEGSEGDGFEDDDSGPDGDGAGEFEPTEDGRETSNVGMDPAESDTDDGVTEGDDGAG